MFKFTENDDEFHSDEEGYPEFVEWLLVGRRIVSAQVTRIDPYDVDGYTERTFGDWVLDNGLRVRVIPEGSPHYRVDMLEATGGAIGSVTVDTPDVIDYGHQTYCIYVTVCGSDEEIKILEVSGSHEPYDSHGYHLWIRQPE
jgi:hypothetical protein